MDGPVDGDPIDMLLGHASVKLLDCEWAVAGTERLEDGTARLGQAMALSGEQVGNSLACKGRLHMQLSCNNLSEDRCLRQALLFAQE